MGYRGHANIMLTLDERLPVEEEKQERDQLSCLEKYSVYAKNNCLNLRFRCF